MGRHQHGSQCGQGESGSTQGDLHPTPAYFLASQSLSLPTPPNTRLLPPSLAAAGRWRLSPLEIPHAQKLRPGRPIYGVANQSTRRGLWEEEPSPQRPAQTWGWPQSPQIQSEGIQGFIGSVPGSWHQRGALSYSWDLPRASSLGGSSVACESVSAASIPPSSPSIRGHQWQTLLTESKGPGTLVRA